MAVSSHDWTATVVRAAPRPIEAALSMPRSHKISHKDPTTKRKKGPAFIRYPLSGIKARENPRVYLSWYVERRHMNQKNTTREIPHSQMCPISSRGFHPITPGLSLDFIARSLAHYHCDSQARRGGKRPQQAAAASSSSRRDSPATGAKRASRLARENDVSAGEETDIKEAFRLFAVRDERFASGREDVMPVGDVRRALMCVVPYARARHEVFLI